MADPNPETQNTSTTDATGAPGVVEGAGAPEPATPAKPKKLDETIPGGLYKKGAGWVNANGHQVDEKGKPKVKVKAPVVQPPAAPPENPVG